MKAPRKIYFEKGTDVPNSNLPVLLFRSVLAADRVRKGAAVSGSF